MTASTGRVVAHRSDHYRPDIEGLRGLAVLLVVIYHAGPFGVGGGYVGVDVFFVISGFLITGLLLREHERSGRIDLAGFFARRMRRLVPAAAIVLAVTLLLCTWAVSPLDLPRVALDGAASALSIGNIRFAAAGGYFDAAADPSPFLHFWSLSVEEQFYLVWPLVLVLITRTRRPRAGAGLVLLVVFAGSLLASLALSEVASDWAFYLLPTRAWQLAAGGLLAVAGTALLARGGRLLGLLAWPGLAAIIVAALSLDDTLAYPGAWALLPTLGAVAVIAGANRPWGPGLLLVALPMRFLGRISYALYLWHWPLLVLPATAAAIVLPVEQRLALVGVAVVAATVSTLLVEEPIRERLPWLTARPLPTVAAGFSTLVLVVVLATGTLVVARTDPVTGSAPGRGGPSSDASEPPLDDDAPLLDLPADDALVEMPVDPSAGPDAPTATPRAAAPPSPRGRPTGQPTRAPVLSHDEGDVGGVEAPSEGPTPAPTPRPRATTRPTPRPTQRPSAASYALPADVRPSLARARDDEDRLRGDGCLAFEEVRTPRDCVYGDKHGRFVVALVGDSHAAHWFPAFERIAKERGWRLLVYVKVSCPFSEMPIRNTIKKRAYPECADYVAAVTARLQRARPDLVVTAQLRWVHPLRPADESPEAQGREIGQALAKLPGTKVVIVDTPWPGRDVPGCLSRHQRDIRACAIDRGTATWGGVPVRERAAARAAGAALLDFTSVLCDPTGCPVVTDGLIMYRDDHHFTATFARALAPMLDRALARVLDAP